MKFTLEIRGEADFNCLDAVHAAEMQAVKTLRKAGVTILFYGASMGDGLDPCLLPDYYPRPAPDERQSNPV